MCFAGRVEAVAIGRFKTPLAVPRSAAAGSAGRRDSLVTVALGAGRQVAVRAGHGARWGGGRRCAGRGASRNRPLPSYRHLSPLVPDVAVCPTGARAGGGRGHGCLWTANGRV